MHAHCGREMVRTGEVNSWSAIRVPGRDGWNASRVAGRVAFGNAWKVEAWFREAKEELGLGSLECRGWGLRASAT